MEETRKIGNAFVHLGATFHYPIAKMIEEHFIKYIHPECILDINGCTDIKSSAGFQYIPYHMERVWPMGVNKPPDKFEEYLVDVWNNAYEIWDFNIENYEYFHTKFPNKRWKFVPFRYTTCFEQFQLCTRAPRYDIGFTGSIDTPTRFDILHSLTHMHNIPGSDIASTLRKLEFKIINHSVDRYKYDDMHDCKYILDIPHWGVEQTCNMVRIWESLCINSPMIVYDPYNTTKRYFGDCVITIGDLKTDEIYEALFDEVWRAIHVEPPFSVADKYKELTYSDEDYKRYCISILQDFRRVSGMDIPNSVLLDM